MAHVPLLLIRLWDISTIIGPIHSTELKANNAHIISYLLRECCYWHNAEGVPTKSQVEFNFINSKDSCL